MEARIDKIEQEIAALEARELSLTANANRTTFEETELSLIPAKLARLETRYNSLVIALATPPAPAQNEGILQFIY